jgi:hypothetical protein
VPIFTSTTDDFLLDTLYQSVLGRDFSVQAIQLIENVCGNLAFRIEIAVGKEFD